MRIATVAESLVEKIAFRLNLAPIPIIDTMFALVQARTIMAAAKYGVFDALKDRPLRVAEIAAACKTNAAATAKLAHGLVAAGYLEPQGERYKLTVKARRWMLRASPDSAHDMVVFNYDNQNIIDNFEAYLETGKGLDFHEHNTPEEWARYQKAMWSIAASLAKDVAAALPAPANPKLMLDIGGSHGRYSAALCRKHSNLSAIILDLPQAIVSAGPLLAEEKMGDRVRHQAGNALTEDLGLERFDLVFMSQVAHHFTKPQNEDLAKRVARALKPGGVFAIMEQIAIGSPNEAKRPDRRMGALADLFFGASSASGTWSVAEIQSWFSGAGLKPLKATGLVRGPGISIVSGRKA
jgi:SAM-dependent methyltransferase